MVSIIDRVVIDLRGKGRHANGVELVRGGAG